MKRLLLIVLIVISVIAGVIFVTKKQPETTTPAQPTPTPTTTLKYTNITATFEIYTLGTKRIFSDSKYHNKSDYVYITSESPNTIYIKRPEIKWADFFATLPMKLTNECLTTGTGQVFCDGEKGSLIFEINGREDKNALDSIIKNGDNLKVTFK